MSSLAKSRWMLALVAALALCFSAVARAQGADAPAPTATEWKTRGDEAMDALRFRDALDHYSKAYALDGNPALLYNRGRAYEALTQFPEALDDIVAFRDRAPAELKEKVPQLDALIRELEAKVSTLSVTSSVPGARVVVRDRVVGKAPLEGPLRLNAGPATIEVTLEGHHPWKENVDLPGGGTLEVKAVLTPRDTSGILRVTSPVAGARVIIDGKTAGKVPVEQRLTAGKHRILVQADGYEDTLTSAVVVAGDRKEVAVDLEETPGLTSRWWFWTGAGVIVLGGTALTVALLTEAPADEGDIPPGQVSAPLWSF